MQRIELLKLTVLLFLCGMSPAQAFTVNTEDAKGQTLDNDNWIKWLFGSGGSGEVTSTGTITAEADQHGIYHKDKPDVKIVIAGTVLESDGDPDFVSRPIYSINGKRVKIEIKAGALIHSRDTSLRTHAIDVTGDDAEITQSGGSIKTEV